MAVQVTQSFISQLLNRKKKPSSPQRTDIYEKIEKFLKLPTGDLSKLADLQRTQELKHCGQPPAAFRRIRDRRQPSCKVRCDPRRPAVLRHPRPGLRFKRLTSSMGVVTAYFFQESGRNVEPYLKGHRPNSNNPPEGARRIDGARSPVNSYPLIAACERPHTAE